MVKQKIGNNMTPFNISQIDHTRARSYIGRECWEAIRHNSKYPLVLNGSEISQCQSSPIFSLCNPVRSESRITLSKYLIQTGLYPKKHSD